MRETGLLMRPELARKSHSGLKTNTRRLCKVTPPEGATHAGVITSADEHHGEWSWMNGDPKDIDSWGIIGEDFRCPYGVPGDRIWIREEHYAFGRWTVGCGETKAGDDRWVFLRDETAPTLFDPPANGVTPNFPRAHGIPGYYKRNSLFMLRSQCRTVVEITEVQLMRLQEISEEDARAEGISELPGQAGLSGPWWTGDVSAGMKLHARTPVAAYTKLWLHLHGAASWEANPWVWSIHYEKVQPCQS